MALALALPPAPSAVQRYIPRSATAAARTRSTSPVTERRGEVSSSPTLLQVTAGRGLPVEEHLSSASSPCPTVCCSGVMVTAGGAPKPSTVTLACRASPPPRHT